MKSAQKRFNEQQLALAMPRLLKVARWIEGGLGPTEIGRLLGLDRRRAFQLMRRCRELGLSKPKGNGG